MATLASFLLYVFGILSITSAIAIIGCCWQKPFTPDDPSVIRIKMERQQRWHLPYMSEEESRLSEADQALWKKSTHDNPMRMIF
jgi:hypothetical protein